MDKLRLLGTCTLGAALWLNLPCGAHQAFGVPAAQAQDTLRPAVGNPLSKAKNLMAAHNYSGATAQVNVADRQKNKSAYESFVIQEMRGAIAQASGDTTTAMKVFGDLIASGRVSGVQLTQMLFAQTSLAYQAHDFPGTVSWAQKYYKSGGKDPAVRTLVIQAYYLEPDYANAAKLQQAEVDDTLKAKKVPTEAQLQLLAACQKQIQDSAGLSNTMKMLLTYYPKPAYWADLVYALQTKPTLSDRLESDLDKFKVRLGTLTSETDYMQFAQLYLGDGFPGAAQSVIAQARGLKVFGAGPEASREDRLSALVDKTAAATKASLDSTLQDYRSSPATTSQQYYDLGENYTTFKQYDKGIALMEEAIGKGDLRRPALAQLRVGEAYVDAGNKPQAVAAFQAVPTTDDGTSDLAALWLLWLKGQPTVPAAAY